MFVLRSHRRSIGLLTTLLMAFTSIWCCCAPAHAVATKSPVRDCCEPTHCPTGKPASDGCPIIQVREASVAPVPAVGLASIDFAPPLPAFLTPAPVIVRAIEVERDTVLRPSTGPPTLLALHTSLLW